VIRNGVGHATSTVRPALLVIAKAPVAGKVKTRLCPPCTPQQAADLARAALRDTLAAALAAQHAGRRVVVLDGEPGPWLPEGFEVIAQHGDGLAERLGAAFADVGEPAFLVGMDTPQVTPEQLDAGLTALTDHDSALGTTPDGGYWGIGLRTPDPRVFEHVPMSTDHTGASQLARLTELGLNPAILPPLTDVDTFHDALHVAAEAPLTRFAAAVAQLEAVAA
jgi:rSAM/selenodomain-associated transferase 1